MIDWVHMSRIAWVVLSALAVIMQGVWLLDALADLRATGLANGRRTVAMWNLRQVVYRLVGMVLMLLGGIVITFGTIVGIPPETRALPANIAQTVGSMVMMSADTSVSAPDSLSAISAVPTSVAFSPALMAIARGAHHGGRTSPLLP